MKNLPSCRGLGWRSLALLLGLQLCQSLPAAVGFTVTPATVSYNYSGSITLLITGLTSGQSVVVQKFLDANTNGVIDGADLLWQQFQLTDGQASIIGGVTNINVPGDTDSTAGQITARMNFQNTDPALNFIGKYAFKLSSPTGLFSPITNAFTVTNAAHAQSLTGNVINNGTNVPNALVLLFAPPRPGDDGPGWGVAATVANNSGSYGIKVPVGVYLVVAVKSNFLGNLAALPVAVANGATVATNVVLSNATHTISGKLADAANLSIGLPGLFLHATAGGLAGIGHSDTNGHFTIRVGSGHWDFGANGVEALGYVGLDSDNFSINTTTGNVTGLTVAYPKATALFHGSVKDSQNQALAGVYIFSGDNDDVHDHGAFTDNTGGFVAGGLGGEAWSVQVDNQQPIMTNHVFSGGLYTNLSAGQAVRHDFTALLATNFITGYLRNASNNPIANAEINGYATISGKFYSSRANTDANGNYALKVTDGNWSVGVCCQCDEGGGGYCCPPSQNITIANANGVVNFVSAGQIAITTPSPLPQGRVNEDYTNQFHAVTCAPGEYWWASDLPSGLSVSPDGLLLGVPDTCGSNYFSVYVQDGAGSWAQKAFSLVIQPPTDGAVWQYYVLKVKSHRQTNSVGVTLDSGQGPYNAYLGIVQFPLCSVSLATCAVPAGGTKTFPAGNSSLELQVREAFATQPALDAAFPAGQYQFTMHTVSDGIQTPALGLSVTNYPNAPRLTNYTAAQAIHPAGSFALYWDAFSGGTASDRVRLVILESSAAPVFRAWYLDALLEEWLDGTTTYTELPAGLLEANRTYLALLQFIRVTDINEIDYPGAYGESGFCSQTALSLATTSDAPSLGQATKPSATEFRFLVTGFPGQYTIQKSTNLGSTNWSAVLVTNALTPPFLFRDLSATNPRAFYRALIGP